MTKFIFAVLLILTTPAISFCQDTTKALPIFQFVDEIPEFPGGEDALMDYLTNNIRYPQKAADKGISGRVYISFVIDTNGNVVQEKVLRGIDELNEEALRVVKSMPQWKPGKNHRMAAQVQYNLPIVFNLSKRNPSKPDANSKFNSYMSIGKEYTQAGNYELAIVYFTKAIKENNISAEPYFHRASNFNELGFINAACSDWRKAKDLGSLDIDSTNLNKCFLDELQNHFQTQFQFMEDDDAGLIKYLNDNLAYPELAKSNHIQGTVKVLVSVDSLGKLTEAKVYRGIGGGCDEEALRLIRSINQWKPAYKEGIAVASEAFVPIRFRLHR